jgi:enoyl-CoA hydratase/carnithine racemase
MAEGKIIVKRREDRPEALYLVICNPDALNSLTTKMQIDLIEELKKAKDDPTIRAVVLRGEGDRAFSTGGSIGDLDQLINDEAREAMYQRGVDMRQVISSMDKPILAAVNGWCLGAGFEIAMCCDMVYASIDARFGLTETDIGLVPGWGGAIRLPRKITVNRAKEMILLSEKIPAEEARMLGIVNKVFMKDELYRKVDEIVDQILAKPALALKAVKTIVSHGIVDGNVENAQKIEHWLSIKLMSSHDFHEAVEAFQEKRKPNFTGE